LKNLEFYNGSLWAMLMHGPGRFITEMKPDKYVLSLFIGILACFATIVAGKTKPIIDQHPFLVTPLLFVLVSIVIGFLGYSTLLTGTVAALILIAHILGNILCADVPGREVVRGYISQHAFFSAPSRSLTLVAVTVQVAVTLLFILMLPAEWSTQGKNVDTQQVKSELILNQGNNTSSLLDFNGIFTPSAMATDSNKTVYVVDNFKRIFRFGEGNDAKVFVGGSTEGDVDGVGEQALFTHISHIAIDKNDTLYVADSGANKIKKITKDGLVQTIAGTGIEGLPTKGCDALTKCNLKKPTHVMVLGDSELLISSSVAGYLVRLTPEGKIYPYVHISNVKQDLTPRE
jgi:hypothetical protein